MNERIRNQFVSSNPFNFKHISSPNSIEDFIDNKPCVVIASPDSLQNGLSRQLFDKWCAEKKNACVIPGYVVEGTLVHYVSFSAHTYYDQTSTFLKELMPPNIILVHGQANEMGRLKQKLTSLFANGNTKIITLKNCQSVEIHLSSEKMVKTIGKLAEKTHEVGETINGLLLKKGFTYRIMTPDDLHVFSQLSTANITQRITIPYSGALAVIQHKPKQIYESVESSTDEEYGVPTLRVHERVTVKHESKNHLSVHWTTDPTSDMVSDSVMALVLNANREMPKVVSIETEPFINEQEDAKKAEKIVHALLISLFGDDGKLVINVDGNVAYLDKQNGNVECENEGPNERVRTAYRRIRSSVKPIPLSVS
ncbi:Cleavage and polyadenylation specificity factor subunit 3-I [Datura stramonium]|uniref:Cleavage and polyadenylation specificity factor subunit 3-I n=1 Tax=Datura stramonium TaxID=4076 RepID=A0ABS8RUP5_DATST|nr:Cleavage and polyadenylation specificity factor subunit 3-I [Datura stramonium]